MVENTFTPYTESEWRDWLKTNHATAKHVWVLIYKQGSGHENLSREAALDHALCFGWVDSRVKGYDELSYHLYFTPRILAFGASTNSTSINKQLATWAANQTGADVTVLDLYDFEMPIYSMDRELAGGIPTLATDFKKHIQDCDGIVISFAEHNGSYSAAFKNIHDWCSRAGGKMWEGKSMFLLATSPGGRGGQNVLASAVQTYPHQGGRVAAEFSLLLVDV